MKGFGSDGFRGIIGSGFTRESLTRIAAGAARLIRLRRPDSDKQIIPVGYDTRFMSRECALYIISILRHEGLDAKLAHCACPSPYISFAARHFDAVLGIQVTSSHNPYYYNGVKLKGNHGGSLLPADVNELKQFADAVDPADYNSLPFPPLTAAETFDVTKEYGRAIAEAAGSKGNPEQNLVVDYLSGSSAVIYRKLLTDRHHVNTELRTEEDPLFGYSGPEPCAASLEELCARVRFDGHESIGLAFDGDGDRLAVADEEGRLLETHEIFAIMLEHVVLNLEHQGPVVRTVSFSSLVDKIARRLGCELVEVPVGYKSVSEAMLNNQAVIGGEESGGTGFGHYLPERDALLMALLLLDARAKAGMKLVDMVEDLYARYGRTEFIRVDVELDSETDPAQVRDRVATLSKLKEIGGEAVKSVGRLDGVKLRTTTGWILVRPSGTESLLRIYAEAKSEETAGGYVDSVLEFLGPEFARQSGDG